MYKSFLITYILLFISVCSYDIDFKNDIHSRNVPTEIRFCFNKLYAQWTEVSEQLADTGTELLNGNSWIDMKRRNDTLLSDYIPDTSNFSMSQPQFFTSFILTKNLKWIEKFGSNKRFGYFTIDSASNEIISKKFPFFGFPSYKNVENVHLRILYLDDDYLLLEHKYGSFNYVIFLINRVTVDKLGLGRSSN